MEVVQCLVALVVVLILGQFLHLKLVARRLPPGPSPLPIVGNLWTLKFVLSHETLMQLAKTYGNTMTLWMGMVPVVVFNGYEAVRDMLVANSDETSARPLTPYVMEFGKKRGILSSNGHTWKQQRRFGALMLRSLGVGKKSMESRIQEEAQHLVDLFASQEGRPIDPKSPVMASFTNVIAAVVFGHRFSYDDPVLHKLIEGINLVAPFMYSICGQLYERFPRVMHLIPGPHQKVFELLAYIRKYTEQEVRMHQESPSDEPRDLIDLYINQISRTKDEQNSTYDEANMVQVGLDLFIAGSDTTTVTLLWALLYMGKYPHIQEKVQLELDNVIENSEIIQYEHHKKLPYTYAVINETLRYSSIGALGLPRECAKDTTIQGFPIKKGTFLLYNLFSVLHDHNHWEKPEEFNPSRFLDEDGNFVKKETLIPFAAGHRSCLGEQMARVEFFIFFTNLLREFTFRLPDGVKSLHLDYSRGTVLHPIPYKICAVPKKDPNYHAE